MRKGLHILNSQSYQPRPWFKALILLGILVLTEHFGSAQVLVKFGDVFPESPARYDWYVDTVKHQLWQRKDTWTLRETEVDSVVACHVFLSVQTKEGLQIYEQHGTRPFKNLYDMQCSDSVVVVFWDVTNTLWEHGVIIKPTKISFFDHTGRSLRVLGNYYAYVKEIRCNGDLAWCMPEYFPEKGQKMIGRHEIHNWGVFGGNGRWVIPPIYDEPFRFENGIAEVVYYGQKRKINEKGEFVE